jgi:hypothetical protein
MPVAEILLCRHVGPLHVSSDGQRDLLVTTGPALPCGASLDQSAANLQQPGSENAVLEKWNSFASVAVSVYRSERTRAHPSQRRQFSSAAMMASINMRCAWTSMRDAAATGFSYDRRQVSRCQAWHGSG